MYYRLQREKESLEAKMKTMSKTHDITSSSTTSRTVRQDFKLKQELHDLKDINFQQTEEVSVQFTLIYFINIFYMF